MILRAWLAAAAVLLAAVRRRVVSTAMSDSTGCRGE
jgi:hypothetical protein